jgi:hypothetical protein
LFLASLEPEKRLVMAEFAKETTYDEENLLSMSKENIIFSFYLSYFLVKVTPVAPTTSFAYLAIFFAFSIVPSTALVGIKN